MSVEPGPLDKPASSSSSPLKSILKAIGITIAVLVLIAIALVVGFYLLLEKFCASVSGH